MGAPFPLLLILVAGWVAPGQAQTVALGGAVDVGVQRFDGDPAPNRLNGSAIGWALLGDVRLRRVVARVEGWRDTAIEDAETTTLMVSGRPVTIQSVLAHDAHAVAALGGYVHDLSARVQVAGVAGISYMTLTRTFTTDAGQLILVPPSTIPIGPATARIVDRYAAWSLGADIGFRTSDRIRLTAGVRSEPLRMKGDISGLSVRLLAGAVWTMR